jgi:hypothetical protein
VGQWQTAGEMEAKEKRSFLLPIIPRRADHYRLKLTGEGTCRVESLTRQVYSGGEGRTR